MAKNESTDFFASLDFVVDVIVLVAAAAVVVAAVVDVVVVVGAAAAAAAAVDVVVVVCDRSGVHVRQLFPQKKMQNTVGCRQKLADFSQKNEIGAARPKNNTSIKQPVVALAGSPGSVTYRLKGFLKVIYLVFFLATTGKLIPSRLLASQLMILFKGERN